jgi:hypothetical protein
MVDRKPRNRFKEGVRLASWLLFVYIIGLFRCHIYWFTKSLLNHSFNQSFIKSLLYYPLLIDAFSVHSISRSVISVMSFHLCWVQFTLHYCTRSLILHCFGSALFHFKSCQFIPFWFTSSLIFRFSYSFIYPSFSSFVHSFVYSLIHALIHACAHFFVHPLIDLFLPWLICAIICTTLCSLIGSLVRSLIHVFAWLFCSLHCSLSCSLNTHSSHSQPNSQAGALIPSFLGLLLCLSVCLSVHSLIHRWNIRRAWNREWCVIDCVEKWEAVEWLID